MIAVREAILRGNGMTVTFDNNDVVDLVYKYEGESVTFEPQLTQDQLTALTTYVANTPSILTDPRLRGSTSGGSSGGGGETEPGTVTLKRIGSPNQVFTDLPPAIAVAVPGDTIVLSKGVYTGSVTIPPQVLVRGESISGGAVIQNVGTQPLSLGDFSTIDQVTVAGSPTALETIRFAGAIFTIVNQCTIQPGVAVGGNLFNHVSGAMIVLNSIMLDNGGAPQLDTCFLSASNSPLLVKNLSILGIEADNFIRVQNSSLVALDTVTPFAGTELDNGIRIEAEANIQMDNCQFKEQGFGAQLENAIVFDPGSDGCFIEASDSAFMGEFFDILVDPSLTGISGGTGNVTTIVASNTMMRQEKFGVRSLAWQNNVIIRAILADIGVADDPQLRVVADMGVGISTKPGQAAFGEGLPTVFGQFVLSDDGFGGFTDNTTAAASVSGSQFNLVPTGNPGEIAYFGHQFGPFPGITIENQVNIFPTASSSVGLWEYWNGGGWFSMNIMGSEETPNYVSSGQNVFNLTGTGEHIRFGETPGWSPLNINGIDAYWARFRLFSPITLIPSIERVRLLTNCTKFNEDGRAEYFGTAMQFKSLGWVLDTSATSPLGAPGAASIAFSPNNTLQVQTQFGPGVYSGFGGVASIPEGLNTAQVIIARVQFYHDSAGGDYDLRFISSQHRQNDLINGSAVDNVSAFTLSTNALNNFRLSTATFAIPAFDLQPGDVVAFQLARDGTLLTDTFGGNIEILQIDLFGQFYL